MLAAVDGIMEHRTGSAERAIPMTSHLYLVLEPAAVDPLGWVWPLLGVRDLKGRHNMHLSPLEQSGLVSFHKETAAYEEAKRRLTSAASSATPQTDLSQTPGLQAAIKACVQRDLKKQQASGGEANDSGKGRGRGKRGQASNQEV